MSYVDVYLFVLSYYFLSNLLALCLMWMPVSLSYWLTVCVCLMYINMSDNIAFCLSILHFVSCLCNFVLAGPSAQLFIVVLNRNCLTNNDLSCILDTTDTDFLDPWSSGTPRRSWRNCPRPGRNKLL